MKNSIRILFVCTGNTCRSPMAEGIFRDMLISEGRENIMCQSAGIAALDGELPSVNAVLALKETGIDISRHKSRRITSDELDRWDVYFVMSKTHAYILEQAGVPQDKIYVPSEISDPYGGSLEVYRLCRDKLNEELLKFYSVVSGLADALESVGGI